MILKSMTEFVFMLRNRTTSELCKDFPRAFTLPVYNGNQDDMVKAMLAIDAIQWKLTGEYAKFLIKKLELWMFVPCNKDGNVLKDPKIKNDHHGSFLKMQTDFHKEKEYEEAKDRVLFKGFELVEMSRNFNIIANTEKDCQVFASKFKEKFYKCKEFTTVEDLIKCELVLTPTAQKLIGL